MKLYHKTYLAITLFLLFTNLVLAECIPVEDTYCYSTPCCGKAFFNADVLYLRAQQGGFDCGCDPDTINNYITAQGNAISNVYAKSHDPDFRWDPGFRLGLGYEFGSHNWDFGAFWSHFYTKSESDHFHWKLNYDVIDVVLGHEFYIDAFSVRPFIGLRTAFINQKIKSSSTGSYNIFSGGVTTNQIFLNNEDDSENFWGVGPLFGAEVGFDIGCGFSLYGGGTVASLYGDFDVKLNSSSSFLNGTNTGHKTSHSHSCQFATDAFFGIRWEQCICNNLQLLLQLGLEQHRYFDQNRMGNYGDLCLDGGSFSVAIGF